MKRILTLLILFLLIPALPAGAAQDGDNALVRCVYAQNDAAGNALVMTLEANGGQALLTVAAGSGNATAYEVSSRALDALEAFLAPTDPAAWAGLPQAENAPDEARETVTLVFADGGEYTLDDTRVQPEGGESLLWAVRCFLESYTVEAQTCTLRFSSFEGGGPEYELTLSAPEKVRALWSRVYRSSETPQPCGAGYDVICELRGRVPGVTEAVVRVSGPLAMPTVDGKTDMKYIITVDDAYNVTCVPAGEGDAP